MDSNNAVVPRPVRGVNKYGRNLGNGEFVCACAACRGRKHQRMMLIWRGPSPVTGDMIVCLASFSSTNRKTGDMVQVWVLPDAESPLTATMAGRDASVCGSCPHRSTAAGGSGACYVVVANAPESVHRAYKRGNYVPFNPAAFHGRRVRLGAYGDPAMVPYAVLRSIVDASAGVTGYTHQWRECDSRMSEFLMASADSASDYRAARASGWRSFVVTAQGETLAGVPVCPASKERSATQCIACMRCGGWQNGRTGDVQIAVHGATAAAFTGGLDR